MKCSTKQDPNLKLSLPRRILIFILGFIDNLLFGGAVFGWPQLVYVMKKEGAFSYLCGGDHETASQGASFTEATPTSLSEAKIIMGIDFSNVSRCQSDIQQSVVTTNLEFNETVSYYSVSNNFRVNLLTLLTSINLASSRGDL